MDDTQPADEPEFPGYQKIPTYQEFLEEGAAEIQTHPIFVGVKAAFRLLQFVTARERAFIDILTDKGIWDANDTELLGIKTTEMTKVLDRDLIKQVVKAAADGDLKIPMNGKETVVTPDTAIGLLNEFLINEMVSPEGVELFAEFISGGDGAKDAYEAVVAKTEASNTKKRSIHELNLSLNSRELEIYLSKCKLANVEQPSHEDLKKMLNGQMRIPKSPT